MGKQELKQELTQYKLINEALTKKICFLLIGEEEYRKARLIDNEDPDILEQEIEMNKMELEATKNALNEHYFSKNE